MVLLKLIRRVAFLEFSVKLGSCVTRSNPLNEAKLRMTHVNGQILTQSVERVA